MRLLIFGLGYTGRFVARAAIRRGLPVAITTRTPGSARDVPPGADLVAFDAAGEAIARATHLVVTAAPGEGGDPVLAAWGDAIARAPHLAWIGYFSTTGVYGDRQGGWVDETTAPDPASPRARRRIDAEAAWSSFADGPRRVAVDLIRLAGIYGPGRSVFDDLREGGARPIRAPGHAFGRIHAVDIAEGTLAALDTADPDRARVRVLNFTDDLPAASADVIAEAADLLRIPRPAERTLEEAWPTMSPMARSFWSDNRRVSSRETQAVLGRPWHHPDYRSGLRAVLGEEIGDHPEQDPEV